MQLGCKNVGRRKAKTEDPCWLRQAFLYRWSNWFYPAGILLKFEIQGLTL
jgi:hypothetical protein